jgi:ribosomal protein S18 acetylase RimI-like enzyme
MDWLLRPAGPADADFLLRVYASTREDELAQTGWDAAMRQAFVRQQWQAQARHYQQHWPQAEHGVISVRRGAALHPAGRLWLDRRAEALHVLDISLLPEWRGQGLGGAVLRQLMAGPTGGAVSIYVETHNPARRLYDRLGFQPVGQPDGVHQFMRWHAVTTQALEGCDEQA